MEDKNKSTFRGMILLILAFALGEPIAHIFIYFNTGVEYDVSSTTYDNENLEERFDLKVLHWKKGELIRSKRVYGLTQKQIDSVKHIEDGIDLKLRGKMQEYKEHLKTR